MSIERRPNLGLSRRTLLKTGVVWTREEDIQHDAYRPYYYDRLAAGLDEKGLPVAWSDRITGSSVTISAI
jgi:CO/xanthine dehydrogenase Mo-binding subunit